jgi:Phytanoyl-CoA dioxygenase (PhyH)
MAEATTHEVQDGVEPGIRAEIEELTLANRAERSIERERRLLQLRHDAGIALLQNRSVDEPRYPEPDFDGFEALALPETTPDRLTAEAVRAAILTSGCLLVRGLAEPGEAARFGEEIERSLEARDAQGTSPEGGDGYFEPFKARDPYALPGRAMVAGSGSVWAADSPRLMCEMLELFEHSGLTRVIRSYLDEAPVLSVEKCTLRKVAPTAGNGYPGWHQDGRFLGDVRALNVWMALTRCGDEAPGLYLVPRRINEILPTGTEGAVFDWVVSPTLVDEVRGDVEILRPTFEPGDVMLFDDRFLHSTAADPAMPNHRYAIESWFFGPSGFPGQYAPLAL